MADSVVDLGDFKYDPTLEISGALEYLEAEKSEHLEGIERLNQKVDALLLENLNPQREKGNMEESTRGDDASIEPGSLPIILGMDDRKKASADTSDAIEEPSSAPEIIGIAELAESEEAKEKSEIKCFSLKIEGEDWVDIERNDDPKVANPVGGEVSVGEKDRKEEEVKTEGKRSIEEKIADAPEVKDLDNPLLKFIPNMVNLKRKMRKRQVEGSETKTKRPVKVKFGAHKAYEVQYDVTVAHHEFDDNKPEQILDLCLIMDCTGSMSSWIEHCKETLHKVIDATVGRDPNCKVRTAFVGYRDFCDKNALFALHDFSYDADAVKKFITGVEAKGGGDYPEDVQGAIRKALDLSWSGLDDSVKLAVFIADAPAHGRKYHVKHTQDDFPDGNPAGLVLEDMMKEMSDKEILVSLYQLNNENETMYKIMKEAHAQGEEKEGVEYVDMRDIKPAPVKRKPLTRRSSRMGARTLDLSPARLEEPDLASSRRAYSVRTSATISFQVEKMRSSNRLSSRRSCKSGW